MWPDLASGILCMAKLAGETRFGQRAKLQCRRNSAWGGIAQQACLQIGHTPLRHYGAVIEAQQVLKVPVEGQHWLGTVMSTP